jgi:hypothetical protein
MWMCVYASIVSGDHIDNWVLTYSTASVMARKVRFERHNTVLIGLLDTTVKSGIQIGGIVCITIAIRDDTGIHTSAVAVPNF